MTLYRVRRNNGRVRYLNSKGKWEFLLGKAESILDPCLSPKLVGQDKTWRYYTTGEPTWGPLDNPLHPCYNEA